MDENKEDKIHYLLYIVALITICIALSVNFLHGQPTGKQVYEKITEWGIEHPNVVWQQAWLESHCGKYSNNLFGFKTKNGYIKFDDWRKSVAYYKEWQDKRLPAYKKYKNSENIDYYDFLWYIGYRDGKRYGKLGKSYIDYLKRIIVAYED